MVAMGVFGLAAATTVTTWSTLQMAALNTRAYAQRQNDQMRIMDYVKRDIRRASIVEIYNGATLVMGTNAGAELRVTVPDYYADGREDDDAMGSNIANAPSLDAGAPGYGATLIVRYYVLNGAVIRNEAGVTRTIADSAGAFTLAFSREASGEIRSRITFNQRLASWSNRMLARQVEILSGQRKQILP